MIAVRARLIVMERRITNCYPSLTYAYSGPHRHNNILDMAALQSTFSLSVFQKFETIVTSIIAYCLSDFLLHSYTFHSESIVFQISNGKLAPLIHCLSKYPM